MKDLVVIKRNASFVRLYKKGACTVMPSFALYIKERKDGKVYFGISVSKKIGKAHIRNRAKRVLRAAVREVKKDGLCSCEMILSARVKTPYQKSGQVYSELKSALVNGGFLK